MYRKTVSRVLLALLMAGLLASVFKIQTAKASLEPEDGNIIRSKIPDSFTLTVVVNDIVRMKSIHLWVHFDPTQQETALQDIVIYEDLLPRPWQTFSLAVNTGTVTLEIQLSSTEPSMNGTGRIMSITFHTVNPWPNSFPHYTKTACGWIVENCTNIIWKSGYIDTLCGDYHFDDESEITNTPVWYTFQPIPGDLDFSGHVDLVDLAMVAKEYGSTVPVGTGFDFTGPAGVPNGIIDIFDAAVVSKYYCRTTP
jgi:hypothetical protein